MGPGDEEMLFQVYGDPEAMRWVDDGQPIKRAGCASWVDITAKNYELRGYGMSVVEEKETGLVIGFCGLVHPGGQAETEIKYAYLRSHWGLGIATEVATALLKYGAEAFGIGRVIATIAPDNHASQGVCRKAGMREAKRIANEDGSETVLMEWLAEE